MQDAHQPMEAGEDRVGVAAQPHAASRSCDGLKTSRWSLDGPTSTATFTINLHGVPKADLDLLEDVSIVRGKIHDLNRGRELAVDQPVRFLIIESALDGVFGVGGDLALLADLVERRDVEGMDAYARMAAQACFEFADGFGSSVVTLAVVGGTALGGMFEAARSCDVLVAEPGAAFGLPEREFGLFAGAGAMACLLPRIGARKLTEIMGSGRTIKAPEAEGLGIIDVMADEGGGRRAAESAIADMGARFLNAHAVHRGMARANGLTRARYLEEGASWARHALHAHPRDVARMRRIARIQERTFRPKAG